MDSASENAVKCFATGCNCAQAVFSTFAPRLGIGEQIALRISTGFGAGMARLQEVCGAVTGAIMVIGCARGMDRCTDAEAKEVTYRHAQELAGEFEETFGALRCMDLLGCDLRSVEGRAYFEEHDLHNTRCAGYVRHAARLVEGMLGTGADKEIQNRVR
jgi:C_GCAxxG_C_C family probable redox protein